ncbi:hypothetical protein J2Z60_000740 [Lactobacillus colini]|uniref:Bacteriocin immunity protein n=1 Tax=Lactobacillus colini TaxID=1819254 RepID=A0ABS4MD23_9LACO|nr:hypothetical protein [Lactobacillus colini]MBP2057569.1 hypothetical protein [Lactobacillus colini]
MINLSKKRSQIQELSHALDELFTSFDKSFGPSYFPLTDAIIRVQRKVERGDHPYAWANKLILFLQARTTLRGLYVSPEQSEKMKKVFDLCRRTHLNFVYLSPLDSTNQFK